MPTFRVKSVKIYTGQKKLHEYIRGVRDNMRYAANPKNPYQKILRFFLTIFDQKLSFFYHFWTKTEYILKIDPLMVFSRGRCYKRYLKAERYFENYSVDGLLSAENRRASLLAKHSYFASPHPFKRLHQIMKYKQQGKEMKYKPQSHERSSSKALEWQISKSLT